MWTGDREHGDQNDTITTVFTTVRPLADTHYPYIRSVYIRIRAGGVYVRVHI